MPVITLLTDYGPGSEYVGALHAVLAASCPGADRIDLAHDIPAGDVTFGAAVLARLIPLAPVGVHLAVVDPGVGGPRRAVAIACADGRLLVGPDNGLLVQAAVAAGVAQVVELTSREHRREPVSATFHGRDVFAPAAGFLASGGALGELGPTVETRSLVVVAHPDVTVATGRLEATVLGVDRFGNVELHCTPVELQAAFPQGGVLTVVGSQGRLACVTGVTFVDAEPGQGVVLTDGAGQVAIAIRDGSAARHLGSRPGMRLQLIAGNIGVT